MQNVLNHLINVVINMKKECLSTLFLFKTSELIVVMKVSLSSFIVSSNVKNDEICINE